jgi:hypothetical protein
MTKFPIRLVPPSAFDRTAYILQAGVENGDDVTKIVKTATAALAPNIKGIIHEADDEAVAALLAFAMLQQYCRDIEAFKRLLCETEDKAEGNSCLPLH